MTTFNTTADKIAYLAARPEYDAFAIEFCASLEARIARNKDLSDKQLALLDKLVYRAQQPAPEPGAFVGTVGQRVTFTATMTASKAFDGRYGTRYMNVLTDDAGNKIVWWGGRQVEANGDVVVMTATIKAHENYRGVNQTTVSRPRWEIVACGVQAA